MLKQYDFVNKMHYMVIRIELRIFDQIKTRQSVLGPKTVILPPTKKNAETLKTIVCQTAPLAKLTPEGVLIYARTMTFSDKMQIFFHEWSVHL